MRKEKHAKSKANRVLKMRIEKAVKLLLTPHMMPNEVGFVEVIAEEIASTVVDEPP